MDGRYPASFHFPCSMDMTGVTGQFPSSVRMILFTSLLNSLSERDVFFFNFSIIDGEEIELNAGNWIRTAPEGKRQFSASADSSVTFACIQVKAGALEDCTASGQDILFMP